VLDFSHSSIALFMVEGRGWQYHKVSELLHLKLT
jgi:hypothetical protein